MEFDSVYDQLMNEIDGDRNLMDVFARYVLRSSMDFISKIEEYKFLHIKEAIDGVTSSDFKLDKIRSGFVSAASFLDEIYEEVLSEQDLLYLDVLQAGDHSSAFLVTNSNDDFEMMLEDVLRVVERSSKSRQDEQISILYRLSKNEMIERQMQLFSN